MPFVSTPGMSRLRKRSASRRRCVPWLLPETNLSANSRPSPGWTSPTIGAHPGSLPPWWCSGCRRLRWRTRRSSEPGPHFRTCRVCSPSGNHRQGLRRGIGFGRGPTVCFATAMALPIPGGSGSPAISDCSWTCRRLAAPRAFWWGSISGWVRSAAVCLTSYMTATWSGPRSAPARRHRLSSYRSATGLVFRGPSGPSWPARRDTASRSRSVGRTRSSIGCVKRPGYRLPREAIAVRNECVDGAFSDCRPTLAWIGWRRARGRSARSDRRLNAVCPRRSGGTG